MYQFGLSPLAQSSQQYGGYGAPSIGGGYFGQGSNLPGMGTQTLSPYSDFSTQNMGQFQQVISIAAAIAKTVVQSVLQTILPMLSGISGGIGFGQPMNGQMSLMSQSLGRQSQSSSEKSSDGGFMSYLKPITKGISWLWNNGKELLGSLGDGIGGLFSKGADLVSSLF